MSIVSVYFSVPVSVGSWYLAHKHVIFPCEGQGRQKVNGGILFSHTPHVGRLFYKPVTG